MRTVFDILRDWRTPHDPETGEVLEGALPPPSTVTPAQEAAARDFKRRGVSRGADIELAPIAADTYRAALGGMVKKDFFKTEKFQEQQWRADMEGAHPDIVEWVPRMVREMEKLGVPMFCHEVNRSNERQQALYDRGVSKAKPGQGAHPYGCAADVIHSIRGWDLTRKQWAIIGHRGHELAKRLGVKLVWGGDDGPGDRFNWDPAHWEIANWKAIKAALDDAEQDGNRLTAQALVNHERELARKESRRSRY